jgi:hypothetical protein
MSAGALSAFDRDASISSSSPFCELPRPGLSTTSNKWLGGASHIDDEDGSVALQSSREGGERVPR